MTSVALVWAATLLYIFPPLCMLTRKGWPIRAGLTMLLASLLPLAPILFVDGEISPGTGIHMLAAASFVLLALLTIGGGVVVALIRAARRRAPSTARSS